MMTLDDLQTAAVALAGLIALSLLTLPAPNRSSYPAPATAQVERETVSVELSIQEAALRDMLLHD